jgi:thioredoxin-dependent peroxiredoxin
MAQRQRISKSEEKTTPLPVESLGRKIFLGFLFTVGSLYAVILGYHFATPQKTVVNNNDWMDCCRVLCLRYGLIPTGHIANDAKAYLAATRSDQQNPQHSTQDDGTFVPAASQEHPLVNQLAPRFQLKDDRGKLQELGQINAKGPVVLVFYYGYHCSHCVAQLFALQEDIARFRESGATIVAVSSDSSELTSDRMAQYGRFDYPVLSDPDNRIAEKYGAFTPETDGRQENLLHGTFLIDRSGKVTWAYLGTQPFIDNRSLLTLLANDHQSIPNIAEKNASRSDRSEKPVDMDRR